MKIEQVARHFCGHYRGKSTRMSNAGYRRIYFERITPYVLHFKRLIYVYISLIMITINTEQ